MNKIFLKGSVEKAGDKGYRFLASTSSIDRQGDSIDQSGWELKNFLTNPVILWAHKYDELPVGKTIDIKVTERGLEATVDFADHQKAQEIKALVDSGTLNAVSVGFIPKERNGNIITRAELLEISIVPVPANQDAILLSKEITDGIKKDIEEVLAHLPEEEAPEDDETIAEVIETPLETIVEPSGDELETKSGRVISNKNRKALEGTLSALKNAVSEIEGLLALASDEVSGTDNTDDKSSKYVVISRDVLLSLKEHAKYNDKVSENLLSTLSRLSI